MRFFSFSLLCFAPPARSGSSTSSNSLLCSAVPVSSVKVQVNGLSPKHDEKVPILDIAGGFRKRKIRE